MKTEDFDNLCKRLEENDSSLISVSLEYANLGLDEVKRLANALQYNQMVSFVSLKNCGLGYEGMRYLFEVLKKRTSRTRIHIFDDCSESEEIALRNFLKIPDKKRKMPRNPAKAKYKKNPCESYRNGEGLDEKVSPHANNNLGQEYEQLNAESERVRNNS